MITVIIRLSCVSRVSPLESYFPPFPYGRMTLGSTHFLLCFLLVVLSIVVCFTFRDMTHFELIFVKSVRSLFRSFLLFLVFCLFYFPLFCSPAYFIFLYFVFLLTIYWKDYLFSVELPLLPCQSQLTVFALVHFLVPCSINLCVYSFTSIILS